jgi:hypothetical protein
MLKKCKHITILVVLGIYLFTSSGIILNITHCGCTNKQLTGFYKNTCLGCESVPHKDCENHQDAEHSDHLPAAFSNECCQVDLFYIALEEPAIIGSRDVINPLTFFRIPEHGFNQIPKSPVNLQNRFALAALRSIDRKEILVHFLPNISYPPEEPAIIS